MTLRERRASRDGRCVRNWEACNRFLTGVARVIRNRVEMFLDEERNQIYKKGSGYVFYEGNSPQTPSRIVVEFSKGGTVFDDEDSTKILTFMYKLTSWRGNLKFEANTGLTSQLRIKFEIKIKSYRPFTDKQPEIDLFSPFGGNGSTPDPSLYYERPKFPWVQPWFPPKLDPQWWFDLGSFTCGSSDCKRPDIYVPEVIFSDIDPNENDIPFEWPSAPEKIWQQLELPHVSYIPVHYERDEISAPKITPSVSVWRGFLKGTVGKLDSLWRKLFS